MYGYYAISIENSTNITLIIENVLEDPCWYCCTFYQGNSFTDFEIMLDEAELAIFFKIHAYLKNEATFLCNVMYATSMYTAA